MWAAVLAVAGALGTGGVAQAADWTVNNYADPSGGSCPDACSLRHAVTQSAPGETIHIPAENGLPVTLSQGAPIVVAHELTITGDGMDATTIDGSANVDGKQDPHRIFTVQAPGSLRLSGLTLQGGDSSGDDTCPSACSTLGLNGGGAIFSTSKLDLDHVRFTGNRAAVGGAVSSSGTLTLSDVEFAGGSAAFGGGLFVRGTATAQRASFHDLGDGGFGGGAIFVYNGTLALSDSTVADSGSGSSLGGGIENSGGRLTLARDTLAGNARGAIMTDRGGFTEVDATIIGAGFDDNGDWACTPGGRNTNTDSKTGPAITQDDGDNLDEDGHCGLSAPGDRSGDAHLAPAADNGGATPTMALLHGSPALDAIGLCQGVDQRGTDRPQNGLCDTGAFEATRTGKTPTATTEDATAIGPRSARLNASAVDLAGEAGGVHFEWGTTGDQVATGHGAATPVVAVGRSSSTAGFTLEGLQPDRTYFYRGVADNATAASPSGTLRSFNTAPAPPDVTDLAVDTITDTGAEISFTIDPNGADTNYVVKWGTDALTESTDKVDIGARPGPQPLSVVLDKLQPDTTYYVEVVATSSEAPDGVSADTRFATERQLSGHPGGLVTVQDSGDGCPTAKVDWGDGSPAEYGAVECADGGEFGQTFVLRAGHEYAKAGHYPVAIDYGRGGLHEWALIAGSDQHVLRVEVGGPGEVSGRGIECPSLCAASADAGSQVDLAASPGGGAVFVGWSGDCTGTDPASCSVSLDQDRVVTARFAAPPALSAGPGADPATDTTAQLHFEIDPSGADTTYRIEYGTDDRYGQTYGPVDVPAAGGVQDFSPTLTGLRPKTTYHFRIVATNDQGTVAGDDDTFATEPQVAAVAGRSVTVNDQTLVEGRCPTATVDWGDPPGTAQPVEPTCTDQGNGLLSAAVTATHTYAAPGHYPIEIAYDNGGTSEQWALISAPQQATPTPTPTATATPTPTPTATPSPTPTPTPVFHQQVVVRPISGTVLVKRKGTNTFVPLDAKAGLPLGSQVDVTHGRIALTSVPRRGGNPETAQFYAGIFTVTQPGSVTVLTLSGPQPTCTSARQRASAAANKKKVKSRKLWGNGHGSFRTSGRYSAATVRGTQWLVQDTCAGTLTRVAHGLVAVTDRVRHTTVLVRGGKSYLARPRR